MKGQGSAALTHKYSFIYYNNLAFGGENGQVKQFVVFLIIFFWLFPQQSAHLQTWEL
jgi:hypothetical protein